MKTPIEFYLEMPNLSTKVMIETDRYADSGRLAVFLTDVQDFEPYATVSINTVDAGIAADEFVFKTYSENEGILEQMLAVGAVVLTGRSTCLGPVCRLPTSEERQCK